MQNIIMQALIAKSNFADLATSVSSDTSTNYTSSSVTGVSSDLSSSSSFDTILASLTASQEQASQMTQSSVAASSQEKNNSLYQSQADSSEYTKAETDSDADQQVEENAKPEDPQETKDPKDPKEHREPIRERAVRENLENRNLERNPGQARQPEDARELQDHDPREFDRSFRPEQPRETQRPEPAANHMPEQAPVEQPDMAELPDMPEMAEQQLYEFTQEESFDMPDESMQLYTMPRDNFMKDLRNDRTEGAYRDSFEAFARPQAREQVREFNPRDNSGYDQRPAPEPRQQMPQARQTLEAGSDDLKVDVKDLRLDERMMQADSASRDQAKNALIDELKLSWGREKALDQRIGQQQLNPQQLNTQQMAAPKPGKAPQAPAQNPSTQQLDVDKAELDRMAKELDVKSVSLRRANPQAEAAQASAEMDDTLDMIENSRDQLTDRSFSRVAREQFLQRQRETYSGANFSDTQASQMRATIDNVAKAANNNSSADSISVDNAGKLAQALRAGAGQQQAGAQSGHGQQQGGEFASLMGKQEALLNQGIRSGKAALTQGQMQFSRTDTQQNASEIANKVMEMAAKNMKELQIDLDPEDLGKMQLKFNLDEFNEVVSLSIGASNPMTRDLIEQAQGSLRAMLQDNNILLDTKVYSLTEDEGQSFADGNPGQGQGQEQQQPGEGGTLFAQSGEYLEDEDGLYEEESQPELGPVNPEHIIDVANGRVSAFA